MSTFSYFITTAIPYVNSKPHIGHAQELILADALARYYKNQGQKVFLQTGTDDNATKNVLAAQSTGLSTRDFVDLNASKFRDLARLLHFEGDRFVRTSSEDHQKRVHKFIERLNSEDLYTSKYSGLYCSGCEDFFSESDLVGGLCPDHQKEPEYLEEQNIFFRLAKYQELLIQLIDTETIKITPSWRKKEILSFIKEGLRDISLSRSSLRTRDWGIPYPNLEGQTVYVWIDALINYWQSNWTDETYKIHVIGKNVWKFHAVYWPALLLSANLPLPNEIVIHGFLTNEGIKISKSLGNSIDPIEIITKYGVDAFRFYLLGSLPYEQDSDFIEKNLVDVYNSELANKFGNLVSRILALAKSFDLQVKERDGSLQAEFKDLRRVAFEEIHQINTEINDLKPWDLLKNGETLKAQGQIQVWAQRIHNIGQLLEPLLPEGIHKLSGILYKKGELIPQLYPRR